MQILVLLFFLFCCLITPEARFFLIETGEKTTTKDGIFLQRTNSGTFLTSTGKCHKEWNKANHQLTRWNVRSKICGNKECMQVAEKLEQICKQVKLRNVTDLADNPCKKVLLKWVVWIFAPYKRFDILQPLKKVMVDANIGNMEKVISLDWSLESVALKGCAQITSLLERCKSWRPRLSLKRRRGVENDKFGDYQH